MLTKEQWIEANPEQNYNDEKPLTVEKFKNLIKGDVVFIRESWSDDFRTYCRYKNQADVSSYNGYDKRTHTISVNIKNRYISVERNSTTTWEVVGDDSEFETLIQMLDNKTIYEKTL